VKLLTRKQNEVILQKLPSLCPTSHYLVTYTDKKQPQWDPIR